MKTYKTIGIVLSRKDIFEADRIVTIYSINYGKLKLLAKGSRRIKSKIGGRLEPFVLAEYVIAPGRNFDIIIGSQELNNYEKIRRSLIKIAYAYYMAEIVDKLTVEQQSSKPIFDLLIESLDYLSAHRTHSLINIYFGLKLLEIVGFRPQLDRCVNCHKKVISKNHHFSIDLGGLVCAKCLLPDQKTQQLSDNQIKIMRLILDNNITIVSRLRPRYKNDAEILINLTNQFLQQIIEKEIMSQKIINRVIKERRKGKNERKT